MQTVLIILNDAPYGNERPYNALRLAIQLAKRPDVHVRVFLVGDGVLSAQRGQKVPTGYYNIEHMLRTLIRRGGEIAVCGTCCAARGVEAQDLVDRVQPGSLDLETDWVLAAHKVLVF